MKMAFVKRKIFYRLCTLLDTFQHKMSDHIASLYIGYINGKKIIWTSDK